MDGSTQAVAHHVSQVGLAIIIGDASRQDDLADGLQQRGGADGEGIVVVVVIITGQEDGQCQWDFRHVGVFLFGHGGIGWSGGLASFGWNRKSVWNTPWGSDSLVWIQFKPAGQGVTGFLDVLVLALATGADTGEHQFLAGMLYGT